MTPVFPVGARGSSKHRVVVGVVAVLVVVVVRKGG